jgi:hypothetical protein
MSAEENTRFVQRYVQAIDDNDTSDFVAHNLLIPGVSLDPDGMRRRPGAS